MYPGPAPRPSPGSKNCRAMATGSSGPRDGIARSWSLTPCFQDILLFGTPHAGLSAGTCGLLIVGLWTNGKYIAYCAFPAGYPSPAPEHYRQQPGQHEHHGVQGQEDDVRRTPGAQRGWQRHCRTTHLLRARHRHHARHHRRYPEGDRQPAGYGHPRPRVFRRRDRGRRTLHPQRPFPAGRGGTAGRPGRPSGPFRQRPAVLLQPRGQRNQGRAGWHRVDGKR